MEEVAISRPDIWNALYWRIGAWIKGWFGRGSMTDAEAALDVPKHQIGTMRFQTWWAGIKDPEYGISPEWTVQDLPFIMQEMKKIGSENHNPVKRPLPPGFNSEPSDTKATQGHRQGGNGRAMPELGGNEWK